MRVCFGRLLFGGAMESVPAKTIITRNKDTSWFGSDYNMNLYRGCSHGCIYCDSRSDCYRVEQFEQVRVKENAVQIVRDELRRKVRTGVVGSGAMCDAYNPFEKEELVTRHVLELIDAFGFGISMLTKSNLILRDTDIYQSIAEHSPVLCMETITTADDVLAKKLEPGVPVSSERFQVIKKLSEEGIYAGVVMTPLLPFLEDTEENIRAMVELSRDAGAKFLYGIMGVTCRDGQREYFYQGLERAFPGEGLAEKYKKTYGNRYYCASRKAAKLWELFSSECEKAGLRHEMKSIIYDYKKKYECTQLKLDL